MHLETERKSKIKTNIILFCSTTKVLNSIMLRYMSVTLPEEEDGQLRLPVIICICG